MKKLYYWYFRRKHSYPCQSEIVDIIHNVEDMSIFSPKLAQCIDLYLSDNDIVDIAIVMGCTRERVRQYLLKIWRKGQKNGITKRNSA